MLSCLLLILSSESTSLLARQVAYGQYKNGFSYLGHVLVVVPLLGSGVNYREPVTVALQVKVRPLTREAMS